MEESIRNAERLIHTMNVALAQIKHDASYDDFTRATSDGSRGWEKAIRKGFSDADRGISLFRVDDFPGGHGEAAIPDDPFDSTGFADTRASAEGFVFGEDDAKMEEINGKIEVYRRELMEREERESLIPAMPPGALPGVHGARSSESASIIKGKCNAATTVAEDLRSKLLQTREIVDRGIQTARELSETVEMLKTKPSKSDKCEESSTRRVGKSRSSEKILEESNSGSTLNSSVYKKCRKCNSEITCKRRHKEKTEKKRENVSVMNLRGRDSDERFRHRKLHTQHLPSLNIRGDLRCQKIPNVDIPPGKCAAPQVHVNTSFELYSHEQILRDKFEDVLRNAKKPDAASQPGGWTVGHTVKCSSCGKAAKAPDKIVNCEEIDELLKACNYNVFDPRIDEFVEKCGVVANEEAVFLQTPQNCVRTRPRKEPPTRRHAVDSEVPQGEREDFGKGSSGDRKMRISELSDELMRKYEEKAIELEEDHLHFESILRDLFEKVDESRHLFNKCDYLDKILEKNPGKSKSNLSITTPVILSYTGGGEEADGGRSEGLRPNKRRSRRGKVEEREARKKPGRRDGDKPKLLGRLGSDVEGGKVEAPENPKVEGKAGKPAGFAAFPRENLVPRPGGEAAWSVPRLEEKTKKDAANLQAVMMDRRRCSTIPEDCNFEEARVEGFASNPLVDPASPAGEAKEAEDASKGKANQSDYESDFEEESPEIRGVAEARAAPDMGISLRYNPNLSTISEVDSEMDRKLSELIISGAEEAENAEKEGGSGSGSQRDRSEAPDVEESSAEEAPGRAHREVIPEDSETSPRAVADVSLSSSSSSDDDDDTGKLLKKVEEHLQEVSSQRPFWREPPKTDAVDILKVPLTNEKKETETLAEKLSVECAGDEISKVTESPFSVGTRGLAVRLESAKEDAGKKGVQVEDPVAVRISEEEAARRQPEAEGSEKSEMHSGGESFGGDPKRSDSKSSFVTSEKKSERLDVSYSEGEISEQEVFCSDGSSSSIGEVISENNSDSSLSEENSALKFL